MPVATSAPARKPVRVESPSRHSFRNELGEKSNAVRDGRGSHHPNSSDFGASPKIGVRSRIPLLAGVGPGEHGE
jgi:hypothetical protein